MCGFYQKGAFFWLRFLAPPIKRCLRCQRYRPIVSVVSVYNWPTGLNHPALQWVQANSVRQNGKTSMYVISTSFTWSTGWFSLPSGQLLPFIVFCIDQCSSFEFLYVEFLYFVFLYASLPTLSVHFLFVKLAQAVGS